MVTSTYSPVGSDPNERDPVPETSPARRRASRRGRLMLVVVSTLMALFAAEVALRVRRGEVFAMSDQGLVEERRRTRETPFMYDSLLGHVPRPGRFVDSDGALITIDERGLRDTGGALEGASILAVGDSFTFGDEVDDGESWPAELQALVDRRVHNGGVSGYGIDQAVLRAERLVAELSPAVVVLAFVSGDIDRCELSYYSGSGRPFFAIEDGKLALRNVPVPRERQKVSWLRRVLGPSFLAHAVLRRVAPDWWYFHDLATEHGQGEAVTRLLLQRLQRSVEDCGSRLVVVALCDRDLTIEHVPAVARAAEEFGIPFLDLSPGITALARESPEDLVFRPRRHLTPDSNHWVAGRIAAFLSDNTW